MIKSTSKYWIALASMVSFVNCSDTVPGEDLAAETQASRISQALACDSGRAPQSQRYEFPVTLASGAQAKMVGYLYYHGSYEHKPLLVAVHGATYNHQYWDGPTINGHSYSFACYMAAYSYAVLALDLIGSGESTGQGTLDGDAVTFDDSKNAIATVLRQLRTRNNPVRAAFSKITLVGHSLGSEHSIGVQAATHAADALVVTGWTHVPPPGGVNVDVTPFLATPYVTFPPEVRTALFYGPSASPGMIAYDNSHMLDHLPRGVFGQAFSYIFQPALDGATAVTGRVLIQLGENDPVFSGSTAQAELASFPNATAQSQVLPTVGHSFNLHPENRYGWQQIVNWLHTNRMDCE